MRTTKKFSSSSIFFGWWIVIASTFGFALNAGLYFYGFGSFFIPLQETFNVGRASLSGAFALARLETGLLGPIEGYVVDRFGPRKIMLLGVFMQGLGFIILSRVNTITEFYIVFVFLLALGSALGFSQPLLAVLANWFINKRGLVMGIATSGIGIGGLFVPILAWIIVTSGWRPAMIFAGVVTWVAGIPLALVMRHRPEQYGYLPDGASVHNATIDVANDHDSSNDQEPELEFTARQALRTKAFWLLGIAFSLRVMVSGSMVIHLIPYLEDSGMSKELAALALGSLAMTSVIGRLGFGWLGDRFDRKNMVLVALAVMGFSMLILAFATRTWHIVAFFILYAPSYGGLAAMMHAIRGDYFGRTAFATISGFMATLMAVGTIIGPVFAGYVFDVTGSYRIAFITFGIATFAALALIVATKKPTEKDLV